MTVGGGVSMMLRRTSILTAYQPQYKVKQSVHRCMSNSLLICIFDLLGIAVTIDS